MVLVILIDMFLRESKVKGPRRNICQKTLSEILRINKICGRFINILENNDIMKFAKRH